MANDLRRGITVQEQLWVQRVRSEILETVNDSVPASDASRIERSLDDLIALLERKAS